MPEFSKTLVKPLFLLLLFGILALSISLKQPASFQKMESIGLNTTLSDFELSPISGSPFLFSQISGKILLIHFWATWCSVCMEEFPSLIKLYSFYKNRGFEIISINLDPNPQQTVPKILTKLSIPFPAFYDPNGKLAELFQIHAIPFSAFISRSKKILWLKNGFVSWDSQPIRKAIEEWLKK